MNKKSKRIVGILAIIIYLLSMTMESYLVNGKSSIGSYGLIAFLYGWLNFNLIGVIWLANPLFITSSLFIMFSKKQNLPFVLSLIASILAISFTQVTEIIRTEAGHTGKIDRYLLGYWLWLLSILLMLIATIVNKTLNKKNSRNNL